MLRRYSILYYHFISKLTKEIDTVVIQENYCTSCIEQWLRAGQK